MLWIAPLSREVVDAALQVRGRIGLIPSFSQVGATFNGYTGFDIANLTWKVKDRLPIHRDHLGYGVEVPGETMEWMNADRKAGVQSIMLDTDHEELYAHARCLGFEVEVGGGEHIKEVSQFDKRIKQARSHSLTPVWVSMDYGPRIKGQSNVGLTLCDRVTSHSRTYKSVRIHNCDYLPAPKWAALVKAGATDFNVAPQLGAIVTLAYLKRAREDGENLDDWCSLVHNSNKWATWTDWPHSAVEAGGQYHLEQLPRKFRQKHYADVCDEIAQFIARLASQTMKGTSDESDNH